MPFGGHPYQLALAALLACILTASGKDRLAVAAGTAQFSFVVGGACMLVVKDLWWWPVGRSALALASWVGIGWVAGLIVHACCAMIHDKFLRAPSSHPVEEGADDPC